MTEIPVESIPGILETGWEPPPSSKSRYKEKGPMMIYIQKRDPVLKEEGNPEDKLLLRVAETVHFRPDPDPANQNFKIGSGSGSRILLALKVSI